MPDAHGELPGPAPVFADTAELRWDPDDVVLPEWARRAAADVDLEALVDEVVRRDLTVAFPDHAVDPRFVHHLRASVHENVEALQNVLCARILLAQVRLTQPLVFGGVQAELHIPQSALQRSYRVGFFAMWDGWVQRIAARARDAALDRDEAVEGLILVTRKIFGYQDHVAHQVAESYVRVEQALGRSRATVRRQLVQGLLDNGEVSVSAADLLTIGYDLSGHHLAVLLPDTDEVVAARLVTPLRAATSVQQTLVHPLTLGSTVIWFARSEAWTRPRIDALCAALSAAGVVASIGEPGDELSGFRTSFAQSAAAERVRQAWGHVTPPAVLEHAQVRLEVLLSRDPEQARIFVTQELGLLAQGAGENERLRETTEVSLRLSSHVAAADHLGLHEHTVRNRLRKVEQIIGGPIAERRTEIQVALRLRRLLGADGR